MRGGAALAALAGATLLGLSPIGVRLSELGPQATNFWRFAIALPILAAWALSSGNAIPERRPLGLLLVAGLLFGAELSLWSVALSHTTVANATFLSNMTPVFAAVFGLFVFKERLKSAVYWGGAVALLGAVVLSLARARAGVGPAETAAEGWFGDSLGFISAIGYAGYLVIIRRLGGRVSTGTVMFWATLAAAIWAISASLVMREQLLPTTWQGWTVLVMLGVVVQSAATGLIAYGVGRLPIVVSTILLWLQPLSAAVISWFLFNERFGALAFVGAGLILAGVFVVQRNANRAAPGTGAAAGSSP
jgi:drug/metabolite transporter (DMT)-like permease